MGDIREINGEDGQSPNTVQEPVETAFQPDPNQEHVNGDVTKSATADIDSSTIPFHSLSNGASMELDAASPANVINDSSDMEVDEDVDNKNSSVISDESIPYYDCSYPCSFSESDNKFFDQLGDGDNDNEMTELLSSETKKESIGTDIFQDAKVELMDEKESSLSASSSEVTSPVTVLKEEDAPSSNVKSEPYDFDNDEKMAVPTMFYPLSMRFPSIASSSLHPWSSSDDLNLPSLFDTPTADRKSHFYGMTGLNNLGNSCYLNSVVQCLANTREFRDYFLSGSYKREINTANRMGSKGKFAHVMEDTLRALWRGDRACFAPNSLRNMMAERNEQFNTYGQQDAQEAMTCIIDSLHEDLNRVNIKPYLSDIESDNRLVEEVAEHTWSYYRSRENSAIYDLFTGMFKSTVECLECHKQNIKFDPYQSVSVPVLKIGLILDCFFHPLINTRRKIIHFRIEINKEHTIAYHLPQLQVHIGEIPLSSVEILVTRSNGSLFGIAYENTECIHLTEENQMHIYELLADNVAKEPVHTFTVQQYLRVAPVVKSSFSNVHKMCSYCRKIPDEDVKRCTYCYAVRYCDRTCQQNDWAMHKVQCPKMRGPPIGFPFVITLREKQLTKQMFFMTVAKAASNTVSYFKESPESRRIRSKTNHAILNGDASSPTKKLQLDPEVSVKEELPNNSLMNGEPITDATPKKLVEWNVSDSYKDMISNPEKNTYPFKLVPATSLPQQSNDAQSKNAAVDVKAIENSIKTVSEWCLLWDNSPPFEPCTVQAKELICSEDSSCFTLLNEHERQLKKTGDVVSLEDCIHLLTKPEVLSKSNAWMCPTCKKPREASKKFEIWSLPTVLVFQLKRFSKPSGEVWRRDKIDTLVDYPVCDLDMSKFMVGRGDGGEYIYDLYGTVVHRGSTWYGHYVSHARCYNIPNTVNDDVPWRAFDDESVDLEDDSRRIISRGAYLLFYRRRGTPSPITIPPGLPDNLNEQEDRDEDVKGPSYYLDLSSRRLASFLSYYCTIL